MSANTISSISALQKEVFARDDVQKQFDEGALLLDIVEHGDQNAPQAVELLAEYDGKYVVMPLQTAPNPNVGVGVAEGYSYPVEGGQAFAQAKYRCRYLTSSLGLTTQTMTRAKGNPQSIFNYAGKEASMIVQNTRRQMNQWLHGDGSGLLATATAGGDNTGVITCDSVSNVRVGMEIIIRDKSAGNDSGVPSGNTTTSLPTNWPVTSWATGDPGLISAINTSANTFTATLYTGATFVGNLSGTTGHSVSNTSQRFGVYHWDAQGRVPYGLGNLVASADNTGTSSSSGYSANTAVDDAGVSSLFGGIIRASNSYWKAINSTDDGIGGTVSSAPISIEDHIQPLIEAIIARDSTLIDQDAIIGVSRQKHWWQVVNALQSGKRTEESMDLLFGKYQVVRYNMITFAYDQQAPSATMRFFAPRYCFRMVASPWQFEDLAGSEWTQILNNGRPTSKWRKNLFSEQQFMASSVRPCAEFTSIG